MNVCAIVMITLSVFRINKSYYNFINIEIWQRLAIRYHLFGNSKCPHCSRLFSGFNTKSLSWWKQRCVKRVFSLDKDKPAHIVSFGDCRHVKRLRCFCRSCCSYVATSSVKACPSNGRPRHRIYDIMLIIITLFRSLAFTYNTYNTRVVHARPF